MTDLHAMKRPPHSKWPTAAVLWMDALRQELDSAYPAQPELYHPDARVQLPVSTRKERIERVRVGALEVCD